MANDKVGILGGPFYFVRHGVTDHNLKRLVMGQQDVPLNPVGRDQARQAARLLAGEGIASIIASPLSRTHDTARIIAEQIGAPIVALLDDLKERNWGLIEGRSHDERPWLHTPEGAETLEAFSLRVVAALAAAVATAPVLIVAHSGTCRVLRRHLAIDDGEGRVPNCVPLRFEPLPQGGWVERRVGAQVSRETRSSKS